MGGALFVLVTVRRRLLWILRFTALLRFACCFWRVVLYILIFMPLSSFDAYGSFPLHWNGGPQLYGALCPCSSSIVHAVAAIRRRRYCYCYCRRYCRWSFSN